MATLTDIIGDLRDLRADIDELFEVMDGREWNGDLWDEVAPLILKLAGRHAFRSPDSEFV
jgi:hypothetical protein